MADEKPKEDDAALSADDVDALLNAAEGKDEIEPAPAPAAEEPQPVAFQEAVSETGEANPEETLEFLSDVTLDVKVELGRSRMYLEDVLRLKKGSVVELDKLSGEAVDIMVNERLVAKGQILVLNNNFCVRITEVVSPKKRKEIAQ